MRLSDLQPAEGARHRRKRVGRGHGSGHVKTSGRGTKGQKARTGGSIPAYFEGGQNRFSQRMPYLSGFKNRFRKEYAVLNLDELQAYASGETVDAESLMAKGLLRKTEAKGLLKILGEGTIDRPLTVKVHKVSESARKQIEAAGGTISLIPMRTYPKTKRAKTPAPEA